MHDLVAYHLIGLVSFACDEDNVVITGFGDRSRDGSPSVGDLDVALPGHSGRDLIDDRLRVFAPRVIARDDHFVGEACSDLSHLGPLAAVAISAAAEYDPEPTFASDFADRVQKLLH